MKCLCAMTTLPNGHDGTERTGFRGVVLARLVDLIYPSIYLWPNPFKIYEGRLVLSGAALRPDDVVLDLGCGAGLHTHLLAKRCGRAVGLDVAEQWIRRAQQELHRVKPGMHVEFVCSALEKAGFGDSMFDKVFSFSVLEHIPNYETVLRECRRVLKPGGSLHFSVDWLGAIRDPVLVRKHQEDHSVVRYFSPAEMEDLLKRCGFSGIDVSTFVRTPSAVELFKEGIRGGFVYTYRESWAKYRAIKKWESHPSTDPRPGAIYLHVRAVKP